MKTAPAAMLQELQTTSGVVSKNLQFPPAGGPAVVSGNFVYIADVN